MASRGKPWQAAASTLVPAADPNWDGNAGLQAEHCRHCILAGL